MMGNVEKMNKMKNKIKGSLFNQIVKINALHSRNILAGTVWMPTDSFFGYKCMINTDRFKILNISPPTPPHLPVKNKTMKDTIKILKKHTLLQANDMDK